MINRKLLRRKQIKMIEWRVRDCEHYRGYFIINRREKG